MWLWNFKGVRRGESLIGVQVGWAGMGVTCMGDGCGSKELVCELVGHHVVLPGAGFASPLDPLGRRLGKSGAPRRGPWGVTTVELVVAPPVSSFKGIFLGFVLGRVELFRCCERGGVRSSSL